MRAAMNKRECIDDALASGKVGVAVRLLYDWSIDLKKTGDISAAESALREGVAYLRVQDSTIGYLVGSIEVFSELANLLAPSPEAISLADELVAIIKAGRAHPVDLLDALVVRAKIAMSCSPIEQAMTCVLEAVKQAENFCFHDVSYKLESKVAKRLRKLGRAAEAESWVKGESSGRVAWEAGHIHMWDLRFSDDGTLIPIPESERTGGPY